MTATATTTNHIGLLDNGGCVVLVGGMARNFGEEYRNNPRVVFWDSQDPRIKYQKLPTNTRAVITIPKFLSHACTDNVMKQVRERRLVLMPLNGTHDVKKALDSLLTASPLPAKGVVLRHHTAVDMDMEPAERRAVQMATTPKPVAPKLPGVLTKADLKKPRAKNGELRQFIIDNVQVGGTHTDEARRLLPKAKAQGIATTLPSLTNAIGLLRKELGIEGGRAHVTKSKRAQVEPKVQPFVLQPPQADDQPIITPLPVPPAHIVEPEVKSSALALLDDLIAGFQLVREAVVNDALETQRLRKRIAEFRRLVKEVE